MRGIKQETHASELGVSQQTVSRVEQAETIEDDVLESSLYFKYISFIAAKLKLFVKLFLSSKVLGNLIAMMSNIDSLSIDKDNKYFHWLSSNLINKGAL